MTQASDLGAIVNQAGATYRAAVNNCQKALASLNSGASAPSTTYAGMHWWDTGNNLIKLRNSSNTAWVTIAAFDGSTHTPYRAGTVLDALTTVKSNLSASADPTTGDDVDDGYAPGSIWLNTLADKAFVCVDNTSATAVWLQINNDNTSVSKYTSSYANIAANTEYTYAHNLGAVPDSLHVRLKCIATDGTWATNDVIPFFPGPIDTAWITQTPNVRRRHTPQVWAPTGSTSSLKIRTPSIWYISQQDVGQAYASVNYAKWQMSLVAVRFS